MQPAPKPKPKVDSTAVQRGIPGMGPKPQLTRPDGRLLDSDLVSLQEQLAKKEEAINGFIEENLAKHQKWNQGWEDLTWRPITPPLEQAASRSTFRPVTCQQLPTPPASVSSENSSDNLNADQDMNKAEKQNRVVVRYASPPDDVPYLDQRRYRRRKGRGGRIMVDRRGVKRPCPEPIDERVLDRHKYSGDSSEDEQLYFVDPYDNLHIKYRMMIDRQGEKGQGVVQRSIGDSNHLHQNYNRSASGHLLPPSNAAG
jgi:enhancer of polycomb-like protein